MEPENPYAKHRKENEESQAEGQIPMVQNHPPMGDAAGVSHGDKQLGLWCHLIPLIVSFFAFPLGFIGPLVIMNTGLTRSEFVISHAKEAINAQISLLIYGIAGIILSLITLGIGIVVVIPVLIGAGIAYLIFAILASIAANNGQSYRYPLCIRFVK